MSESVGIQGHDLTLQIIGQTETGFMLMRQQGRPMMSIGFSPTPQARGASDVEATYTHMSPEIEKVVSQEDWRKGMGEDKYSDAKSYAESIGCDARSLSGVVLGPVKNDAPLASPVTAYGAGDIPVLVNGGFETWVGTLPDGWVKTGTPAPAKETTVFQGGATSLKWVDQVQTNEMGVKQVIGHNGCFSTLPQITFSAYFYATTANDDIRVRFMLNGAQVAATTKTDILAATWTQISVNYTPTNWNDANEIQVEAAFTGDNLTGPRYIDTAAISFSGQAYQATAAVMGTPTWLQEYSSGLYLITSTAVWKWNTSTSKWDRQQGSPPNGISAGLFTDGTTDYMMLCRGTTRRWWRFDGTTWAINSLSGDARYANFFLGIGATAWKAMLANKLASATDPFNGAWTQVTIGDVSYNITGLINVGGNSYIGKANGLFKYVGTTVTEISTQLRSLNLSTTGENLAEWKSYVYFPAGAQALYQYDPGDNVLGSVSPADRSAGMVAYSGRIYALAGDEQYLYAFVGGASGKIELLCGRYETISGSTSWVWHPILQLTASDVAHCMFSTVTSPSRLWFISTESGTNYIRYVIQPDKYSDVTQATSYTFATGGSFIIGTMDMGFVDQDKAFASLVLLSENLTANLTVVASYKIDADASWTTLGTFNTSPLQTLYFPTASVTKGKKIRLRFVLATNSTASTPKIKAYALHGLLAFGRRHTFNFTVKIADGLRLLSATEEENIEPFLAGTLRNMAEQGWVVLKLPRETLAGVEADSTYYVRLLSLQDDWIYDEADKRVVRGMTVQAVEVKLAA